MIAMIPGEGKAGIYADRSLHSRKRLSLTLFIFQDPGLENLKSFRAASDEKFCWYTRIYPSGIDWEHSVMEIRENRIKQKYLFIKIRVLL
jgi:hypothetical protein